MSSCFKWHKYTINLKCRIIKLKQIYRYCNYYFSWNSETFLQKYMRLCLFCVNSKCIILLKQIPLKGPVIILVISKNVDQFWGKCLIKVCKPWHKESICSFCELKFNKYHVLSQYIISLVLILIVLINIQMVLNRKKK